jgi:outer membrane protein OmpA-like peptidoglycan-associated protein/tetratricopeptide (TPR) repeat protein
MKNIIIATCFIFANSFLFAQNKSTKKADKQYSRLEYVAAAASYQKLAERDKADTYVFKQLGDCFYNIFNPVAAVTWYEKAIASEKTLDAETYYKYSQMLKASGKYEDANIQMSKFASLVPNDQRAKAFLTNPNYLPKLLSQQKEFDVKVLTELNSEKSDFGAYLNGSDFYFASARNKKKRNYGWANEPFLDIYKAVYNTDGTTTNPLPVSELNSKYNDGPVTVSANGKTMYFASESLKDNNFVKASNKDKMGQVNLFKSEKMNDKWTNFMSLPFNGKGYSCGNPCLSQDGKTLYFGSNMPGSFGGADIWKVTIKEDGSFGQPENLGSNVNTEGNENFPFISDDNSILYFASNGRQGLGGLDIFHYIMGSDKEATNLGKPVNSEKDDFAFSLYDSKNIGYFSSNRTGNDDIYQATPICALDVTTIVNNTKTGAILADAKVAIVDENKNVIATETTNDKGEVNFKVLCDKVYTLQVSKDGFEGNIYPVEKVAKTAKTKVYAALNPIEVVIKETEIVLNPIYFEFNKSNITQEGAFELDKLVQVMTDKKSLVVLCKSHTDLRGGDLYNMNLSDLRANATVQYVISKGIEKDRILGKGFGESEPKVTCIVNVCTEEEHQQNRRSEFLIVK